MKAKITLDGRKGSLTLKGFPVVYYFSKDKKDKRIRTGYYSQKKDWDLVNAIPKRSHPDYVELFNFLRAKKFLIADLLEYAKLNDTNFHFAEKFVSQIDTEIFYEAATQLELPRMYGVVLRSFQKVFPNYSFSMITKEVAEQYRDILINTPTANNYNERSINGVITYLTRLVAVWNKLKKPNNPFSGVAPKKVPTRNKHFTVEDLLKIKNHPYKKHPNSLGGGVYNYLNYLLLQFYLGGIDLVDLAHMTYQKNVINGRLEFNRAKGGTNVFCSNKIFPEAWEILEKYDCKPYLIPLLKENNYQNFLPNTTRMYESIRQKLQLSKLPYAKAPRYSFITRAQQLLIDERITIEIVGHSQSKTHSIYTDEFPFEVRDAAHKSIINLNVATKK